MNDVIPHVHIQQHMVIVQRCNGDYFIQHANGSNDVISKKHFTDTETAAQSKRDWKLEYHMCIYSSAWS